MAGRRAKSLGEFIKAQRQLANLSVRRLAEMADMSSAYLSQVERGIYQPSAKVLKSLADALHISAEHLYTQVGLLDDQADTTPDTERVIRLDPRLSTSQKEALIGVYRGFVGEGG